MALVFRYASLLRSDGTLHHAPIIKVFAHTVEGRFIEVAALVDSGADSTVVPADLAVVLGLSLGEEIKTGGLGGMVLARKSMLSFTLAKGREKYVLTAPALVLVDNVDVPLILGRNGFFEQFHVYVSSEGKEGGF